MKKVNIHSQRDDIISGRITRVVSYVGIIFDLFTWENTMEIIKKALNHKILIGIIIVGIAFLFLSGLSIKHASNCSESVTAVIVSYEEHGEDDEYCNKKYHAVYKFSLGDETYTVTNTTETGFEPKIGKEEKIKVNPDNPIEIYVPKTDTIIVAVFMIVGITGVIGGIIMLKKAIDED